MCKYKYKFRQGDTFHQDVYPGSIDFKYKEVLSTAIPICVLVNYDSVFHRPVLQMNECQLWNKRLNPCLIFKPNKSLSFHVHILMWRQKYSKEHYCYMPVYIPYTFPVYYTSPVYSPIGTVYGRSIVYGKSRAWRQGQSVFIPPCIVSHDNASWRERQGQVSTLAI